MFSLPEDKSRRDRMNDLSLTLFLMACVSGPAHSITVIARPSVSEALCACRECR